VAGTFGVTKQCRGKGISATFMQFDKVEKKEKEPWWANEGGKADSVKVNAD